jgi:hypothetical protein
MVERAILEKAFAEGGSVLLNGRIIMRLEDLPSEFELAEGDAERQAAVLAQEEAELAARQERVARLRAQVKSQRTSASGKPSEEAALRANLEAMTVAELRAEAEAEGITVPASVDKKSDLVDFLVAQAQGKGK